MSKINDGGPAFPGKASINRDSGELRPYQFGNDDFETLGMALRDYFAAKAMQGYITRGVFPTQERAAALSYEWADARASINKTLPLTAA